jgi:hypothetical protein
VTANLKRKQHKAERQLTLERKAVASKVAKAAELAKKSAEKSVRRAEDKTKKYETRMRTLAGQSEKLAAENRRLKEQIEKGETDQSQGLLEEKLLLKFLIGKFPDDKYEHPGKGGDILQHVRHPSDQVVGLIVYEVKRVATFQQSHVRQASAARRQRAADYAILVTNAFPARKKLFYVDRDVLVISPAGLEPLVHTARASLLSLHKLKASGARKQQAVQAVYNYLAGGEYSGKIADIAGQRLDLEKVLREEWNSHKRIWRQRLQIYGHVFSDVTAIDYRLRSLVGATQVGSRNAFPAQRRLHPGLDVPKEMSG